MKWMQLTFSLVVSLLAFSLPEDGTVEELEEVEAVTAAAAATAPAVGPMTTPGSVTLTLVDMEWCSLLYSWHCGNCLCVRSRSPRLPVLGEWECELELGLGRDEVVSNAELPVAATDASGAFWERAICAWDTVCGCVDICTCVWDACTLLVCACVTFVMVLVCVRDTGALCRDRGFTPLTKGEVFGKLCARLTLAWDFPGAATTAEALFPSASLTLSATRPPLLDFALAAGLVPGLAEGTPPYPRLVPTPLTECGLAAVARLVPTPLTECGLAAAPAPAWDLVEEEVAAWPGADAALLLPWPLRGEGREGCVLPAPLVAEVPLWWRLVSLAGGMALQNGEDSVMLTIMHLWHTTISRLLPCWKVHQASLTNRSHHAQDCLSSHLIPCT